MFVSRAATCQKKPRAHTKALSATSPQLCSSMTRGRWRVRSEGFFPGSNPGNGAAAPAFEGRHFHGFACLCESAVCCCPILQGGNRQSVRRATRTFAASRPRASLIAFAHGTNSFARREEAYGAHRSARGVRVIIHCSPLSNEGAKRGARH